MKLPPFKLERYFAKYEFALKYSLSSSDCDGLVQKDLLMMASSEEQQLWANLRLGYTESQGSPLLRKEIVKLYESIEQEQILVVVPEEGIYAVMNSILDPGDHVICTFPGYQSLYEIAQGIGCKVSKWEPEENEGWKFDSDKLQRLIRKNTKLIVFNFPHNPTGNIPPRGEFEKIIKIAKDNGLYVFSDEMYRLLEFDVSTRLPSVCDIYDKAISLFGMSKTFGLAGLRIGWLATKDKEVLQKISDFKDYTTICSSAPSEILAVIALRNKERIIESNLAKLKKNLEILDKFFQKHQDLFSWFKPKAGSVCFPRIKNDGDSSNLCKQVIKNTGVMILPSEVYDYDKKHFRIGFGRENLPEALSLVDNYITSSRFK